MLHKSTPKANGRGSTIDRPFNGQKQRSPKPRDSGAGSFARARTVLDAIARAGESGAELRELVATTGLARPTFYRAAAMLAAAGWIERDVTTRRFFLGPEMLALGAGALAVRPLTRIATVPLAKLAADIEQPVYLVVRSGMDSLCISRDDSSRGIQTLVLQVGSREPLGIGAGSMALLAALPEDDMQAFVEANRPRYRARPGFNEPDFDSELAKARKRGFAAHDGVFTSGVSGIGVAVTDSAGYPLAGISTAFISAWLPPNKRPMVVDCIAKAARDIAARLQGR